MGIVKKIFDKVSRNYYLYKSNKFLKKLKTVGTKVSIRQPVCFEGAEFIEIGNNVSIAAFVHIWGHGGVKIGNGVMIASHTAISTITHDTGKENMIETVIAKSIVIEDNVWIGAHAVIMPGVTIKKGAVIGAGAVVLKDVEPYQVVGGVPATVIKERNIYEN